MIGAPIAMHRLSSAPVLTEAAAKKQGLTHVMAGTLAGIWSATGGVGLSWNDQYDAEQVFVSDGPVIHRFPCDGPAQCQSRVWTLGAERFVTGRNLMTLNISVSAAAGLKEVSIFNGRELYRRYAPAGAPAFHRTLLVPGETQKNLVLIAEDRNGGKATAFAHKNWKDGTGAPVFCSDHFNDGSMKLFHGPGGLAVSTVRYRHTLSLHTDVCHCVSASARAWADSSSLSFLAHCLQT